MVVAKQTLCDITFMLKRRVFMRLCDMVLFSSVGVWVYNSVRNSPTGDAGFGAWCGVLLWLMFCLWLYYSADDC